MLFFLFHGRKGKAKERFLGQEKQSQPGENGNSMYIICITNPMDLAFQNYNNTPLLSSFPLLDSSRSIPTFQNINICLVILHEPHRSRPRVSCMLNSLGFSN